MIEFLKLQEAACSLEKYVRSLRGQLLSTHEELDKYSIPRLSSDGKPLTLKTRIVLLANSQHLQ